jgi:8-amino-3,8-dideoxy-alpha-D-manno-octulosonate transaminase
MPPERLGLPREFPGAIWYDEEEVEAIARVVQHQSPFRFYGPALQRETEQFEAEFARFLESVPGHPWPESSDLQVTAVNSGTGALEVAMDAFGVGPGDEVAVQGFMWISTIGAIVRNGAVPVLVDSDDTLNMSPEDLRRKVSDRTALVVPVPMAGGCARIGEIMEQVRAINADRRQRGVPLLRVLEDNAQCVGATAWGVPGSVTPAGEPRCLRIGLFGDAAIFSLQLNKNITCGEGGVVVTRDPALHQRIRSLHDVGFLRDARGTGNVEDPSTQVFTWGQGRRFTEIQAALARVQLRKLDGIVGAMRASHARIEAFVRDQLGLAVRARADPQGPGDTGYFLLFHLPEKSADEGEQIAYGRRVAQALCSRGLPSVFLHDYEVHIYYNIPQLVHKMPVNNGHPWNHPANQFHETLSYARGALPHFDRDLIRTIGFNVPSRLAPEHEAGIVAVLEDVYRTTIQ